jgi:hypothetical protein
VLSLLCLHLAAEDWVRRRQDGQTGCGRYRLRARGGGGPGCRARWVMMTHYTICLESSGGG